MLLSTLFPRLSVLLCPFTLLSAGMRPRNSGMLRTLSVQMRVILVMVCGNEQRVDD